MVMVNKNTRDSKLVNMLRGRDERKHRRLLIYKPRSYDCLRERVYNYLKVHKLDHSHIKSELNCCRTIEHQIIKLRLCTQMTTEDYQQRLKFTRLFLRCLNQHHNTVYEGILFGSTVNGLGFRDSDVDLRLRALTKIKEGVYEPVALSDFAIERILRNIAHSTTRCCPAIGEYVPSIRCPVAKLTFYQGRKNPMDQDTNMSFYQAGLSIDVSLSSSNPLASFNTKFLRFLCFLQPKFHLLATVLRYWSTNQDLIVPGQLSSYALVNLMIYFCQTLESPLLPTVDKMREVYFSQQKTPTKEKNNLKALTQLEWHCLVCLDRKCYKPSTNTDPLTILLLKFFEFCLTFPYSDHILTIRTGHAIHHKQFEQHTQFHPRFRIGTHISIQDPFDLKHNLTGGMKGGFFQRFMITVRHSYERLFREVMNNFLSPNIRERDEALEEDKREDDWGLNTLFVKLTEQELKQAQ